MSFSSTCSSVCDDSIYDHGCENNDNDNDDIDDDGNMATICQFDNEKFL
jgi:hypothetical protein